MVDVGEPMSVDAVCDTDVKSTCCYLYAPGDVDVDNFDEASKTRDEAKSVEKVVKDKVAVVGEVVFEGSSDGAFMYSLVPT